MPVYTATLTIARPLEEIFAFFSKTANLVALIPPDVQLELQEGPEVLQLGSRLVWKARRWGVSQKIIQEITRFDVGKLIIEEQRQGPLARWVHATYFEEIKGTTSLRDEIQFDPPGGLLGYVITADAVRKDLDSLFAHREKKIKEMFK